MIQTYLPALVFLVLGSAVGVAFIAAGSLLGPRRAPAPTPYQDDPYESGLPSEVNQGLRFDISFYLIAMLFILFDIEVVFLIPWTFVYRDFLANNIAILSPMLFFLFVLVLGLFYEVKKGALEWEK